MPKPLEHHIEAAIRDYLELHGWYTLKTDAGESSRATRQTRRGTIPPGFPDLLALKGSRFIAIEVKRPGHNPTTLQRQTHTVLKAQGVPVFVVRSVEDLEPILKGNP